MNVYLSGWQGGIIPREKRLLASGVTHQCFSFINVELVPQIKAYYIGRVVSAFHYAEKHVGIMMDSGVFSLRRYITRMARQGVDYKVAERDFMRQYAAYCLENGHKWDFYVTADFQPDQPAVYRSHLQLEKMGLRPMPVFHGDASIDYLKRYRDRGYTCVGIGLGHYLKHKRRHLQAMFDFGARYGVEFHGLAVTSPMAMLGYPWKSVDSSSWSRVAAVGGIMRFDADKSRIHVIHVSDRFVAAHRKSVQHLPADMVRRLERELNDEGFDLAVLRDDFVARHIYNARAMMALAAAADIRHGRQPGGFRRLV